jgi:hypothetical protein
MIALNPQNGGEETTTMIMISGVEDKVAAEAEATATDATNSLYVCTFDV